MKLLRLYRLARRTFPKHYGRRTCWGWAKETWRND